MNVFHIEANGKTNTAEYVSRILQSVNDYSSNDINLKVFTSQESDYPVKLSLPVFKNYGSTKNILTKIYYYIAGLIKIYRYIAKSSKVDILHFHWLKISIIDYLIILLLKYKKGVKIVFTAHNILPHEYNIVDKLIYPKIYKKVDYFTFHSTSVYQNMKNITGVNPQKYKIIPHYSYEVNIARRINNQNNKLLFFGIIREYKGVDILIKACKIIDTEYEIDWSLSIVGKPEIDIDNLKEFCQKQGLEDKINWRLGWIDESIIENIFNSHDIIILPYKKIDNSGLLHLAMSFGKPIIASRLGSLKDIIKHNENGLLFHPGDPNDLAHNLYKLLNSKTLRQKLGNNAYKLMNTKHSINRIGKLHYKLYKSIIK